MGCKKIKINSKYYTKATILSGLPTNINWLWKNINFAHFQETNFFLQEDLDYLKFLIEHILSSNLFRQIYEKFNNVSSLVDFYFSVNDNVKDYVNRIIFLPFSASDFGKFAITDRRTLSVLVAGFPEKKIRNLKQYRIYRILELALRSIILSDHEPCHFIKAALCLLTQGIISRNTSHTNDTIESGFFFEEVLFGWVHLENNPLNLVELGLLKNVIQCKNPAINNKKIDLITAITLLDPEIYDGNLTSFRENIFNLTPDNLKTFSISSIKNKRYKKYLKSVLDFNNIEKSENSTFSINAGMDYDNIMCIDYYRINHNLSEY